MYILNHYFIIQYPIYCYMYICDFYLIVIFFYYSKLNAGCKYSVFTKYHRNTI